MITSQQTLYNGVKFPVDGPDFDNIAKVDLGALPMINRMGATGLQVDLSHFEKMHKILVDDMDRITSDVQTMTGYYVNIDSGDQVSDLLFKKLGIKQVKPKMTKSGDRESVEDEVLTAIQHEHPVVSLLQEYKEYSKLDGTYVVPMPKLARRVGPDEWRMFPNFGTTRIPSGRLNCKEPNLLAMPNRTERGRQVCEGFITKPGWIYGSVDLSQIEPRVVAHRSGDQNLRNVYFNNEDLYSDYATFAFLLKDERYKNDVGKWIYPTVHPKDHRFPAKTCTLASIYDVTGKGLAEQMPVVCKNCRKPAAEHDCSKFSPLWTEDACQDIINKFYMRYPGIMSMRLMDHARLRKFGYVWDEWGRILHAVAIRSVLRWVVSAALRETANFPIQSTAQGAIKLPMARIDDEFEAAGIYEEIANPLLQIHDELLFECREDTWDEVSAHVSDRFETCVELEVPIKASVAKALTWGTMPK